MARIDLENIAHSYDQDAIDPVYALEKFNLTWDNGGRYAILGPSGCGKPTMLNIMSGLVTPSQGKIKFDGLEVTAQTTAERNIAQVFQFPVIYNTMTVRDNLAFPLVCRNVDKEKITQKVQEVADILNLGDFLDRRASRLTVDQKQLISLGRGLVRDDVAAVLMDEPLTVIDPDLKFRLRRKLKEINEKYKSTLIYVTHDQNEAMTFAHKIIVMNHGRIVQIGTPKELFERPATTFVGYFIGAPAMNFFPCAALSDKKIAVGGVEFSLGNRFEAAEGDTLKLGIRAEFIEVVPNKAANTLKATVRQVQDFGNFKLITATVQEHEVKVKINRQADINSNEIWLKFPKQHCCIYKNETLATLK